MARCHSGQGSSQYKFLAADLAAVNRSVTPWVVVAGHRPLYWIMLQGSSPGPDTSDNFCDGAQVPRLGGVTVFFRAGRLTPRRTLSRCCSRTRWTLRCGATCTTRW